MGKINRNGPSQMLRGSAARGLLALVVVGLLVAPIAVQAELKATELAYTWDINHYAFEWGHPNIAWNGDWIPFLHEVEFVVLPRPVEEGDVPSCRVNESKTTHYAGWVEYGFAHTDTDPEDALGFTDSREWKVFNCDLNGDGTLDDLDLDPELGLDQVEGLPYLDDLFEEHPELVLAECRELDDPELDPRCIKLLFNEELPCTEESIHEHCLTELVTQLFISLDLVNFDLEPDCDGEIDQELIDRGFAVWNPDTEEYDLVPLCVYSEVETPEYGPEDDVWTFPLPVRITDVDGAKTLMLSPVPTAVDLAAFGAEPQGGNVLVWWETANELRNLGFNVYRANSAGGERTRLNDQLIPSQSLGSMVGSTYEFVDRSAQQGMTYHYWLEDVDSGGVGTMNGPVAVRMPHTRRLPCRPRPAPMPGQWE